METISCILHTRCAVFSKTGTGYLGPDTWYLMQINAADRTPSTEDRVPPSVLGLDKR
jgi:hypothetical protein